LTIQILHPLLLQAPEITQFILPRTSRCNVAFRRAGWVRDDPVREGRDPTSASLGDALPGPSRAAARASFMAPTDASKAHAGRQNLRARLRALDRDPRARDPTSCSPSEEACGKASIETVSATPCQRARTSDVA
jgi:hypothetical protein